MSNSSKRVSKAEVELNKAYERLLKNANLTKELILEAVKNGIKLEGILTSVKTQTLTSEQRKLYGNVLKGSSIGANAITNLVNGEDTISVMTGSTINIGLDFGLEAGAKKISAKFAPLVGWFSVGVDIGNFINQLTGGEQLDIGRLINNKLDELCGVTNDLPEILPNGIMRLTMHDGTVYERPLVDIAGSYLLTGENKDDVLFGGSGDDMLNGHAGSDILIGGAGKDDYFVDNGDTIKDSDGKGRVFLSYTNIQLTGGTQIEKGSKIYKGKDGTTYELKGSDLIINDNITIENFSKISNDLGIVLVDEDDIVVTIGNNQSTEGGNGKHSMEFKVTLNRALKKDEFLEIVINGQRVKFKEGDIEQTYTHTWDGNTIKEEDRKFEVSASVVTDKSIVKAKLAQAGNETIIDDDREFANLNLLVA